MPRLEVRCSVGEKELWVSSAEAAGLSLSQWVRRRLSVSAELCVEPVEVPVSEVPTSTGRAESGVASVLARRFGS